VLLIYKQRFCLTYFAFSARLERMDEKQLNELKFHFEKSMDTFSNRNKANISLAWERLVEEHKDKPYHNLDLAYNDLKIAQDLNYTIPSTLIVAAVLRYADFSPKRANNTEMSVKYADLFLSQAFGWSAQNVKSVTDAIRESFFIVSPSTEESFPNRLFHDMKMTRFAKNCQDFINDRKNAKKEFNHIPERAFYRAEDTLLKCYQNATNLFSLDGFKEALLIKAKENISNRLLYVAEVVKYLDSTNNSFKDTWNAAMK